MHFPASPYWSVDFAGIRCVRLSVEAQRLISINAANGSRGAIAAANGADSIAIRDAARTAFTALPQVKGRTMPKLAPLNPVPALVVVGLTLII